MVLEYFIFLGNNLYGAELFQVLQSVKGSAERMAYILMDKIQPTPVQNILLRRDAPLKISNCLSELGVFGAYVRYVILNSVSLLYFQCLFVQHPLSQYLSYESSKGSVHPLICTESNQTVHCRILEILPPEQ